MELISPSESPPLHRDVAAGSRPSPSRAGDSLSPRREHDERLEALEVLASAMAGLAARRRSDDELNRLGDALRTMSHATDSASFADGARSFDRVVAHAAGNALLASGMALVQRGENADDQLADLVEHATETASLLGGYESLADAIAQRDAGRASRSASEIVERLRTAALRAPRAPVNQPSAS